MKTIRQPANPEIKLVDKAGEVTLLIEGRQAMQAWERDLMWKSADILCGFGSEFLEVGLGLGISALHIASNPNTRRHTVVEKYEAVINYFEERHPTVPPALQIVHADFFDYVYSLAPSSLDGIFFDPFFAATSVEDEEAMWNEVVPLIVRALRKGGALVPYFSTRPVLKWPFVPFFDRVIVERHAYIAYPTTEYTPATSGHAFIQCFVKTHE